MTADTKLQIHESIKDDSRDVADIWRDALKSYKGIVGFDLERKFDKVEDMVAFGVKEMNGFHKYRHNEKKVDKLRTLFSANIGYIESGSQQLLSAATPAFPPAAAIGTAVTYMLTACRQVSADYDIVIVFFEDMNAFLQRIVILEGRMPQHKAYQNCLMDVFVSFLTMCGFAHKYIELGRFKKWIQNLIGGQDGDLGAARQGMDTGLNRLENATGFAILGNTEELRRMNDELRDNQNLHNKLLEEQKAVMGSIQDNTEHIREDMAKLLEAFNEQKKSSSKKSMATEHGKPTSARRIRNTLPEVEGEIDEYHILKDTLVDDTGTWVFSDPQWTEWLKQSESDGHRALVVMGERGMGKSHLAATIFEKLQEKALADSEKHTCAAHFYFRERHGSLSSLLNGVVTIINQVAEQNAALCEVINGEYLNDELDMNLWNWEDLAKKLLAPCFPKGGKHQLYLVLDGIDEIEDWANFKTFWSIFETLEWRVHPVFTTRPSSLQTVTPEGTDCFTIEVTKEKLKEDLRSLVWSRLNSLGNLRKFSRYVTQRIADKAEEASPNMLYAEHVLRRFDSIGREGAVLKVLDKAMPPDLDSLYETLLETCYRRTTSEHQHHVLLLLHFVAYSFRPLPLDEVNSFLQHMTSDPDFSIEEIPEVFTFFLRVGDPGSDAEARAKIRSRGGWKTTIDGLEKKTTDSDPDAVYNDGRLHVKFHERSMRNFFASDEGTQTARDSLRWNRSDAHQQIFQALEQLARPVPGADLKKLAMLIQKYSTHYVLKHWRAIEPNQLSGETRGPAMEALWSLMNNQAGFAEMIEWNLSSYNDIFPTEAFDKLKEWVSLLSGELTLSEDARQWWETLKADHKACLMPLAKCHLQRVFVSLDGTDALKAFRPVHQAFLASQLRDELIKKAKENFPNAKDSSKLEHQAALALPGLLGVELNGQAYRIVSEVLFNYHLREPAQEMCSKAIELLDEDESLEKLKSLILMGQILSKRGYVKKAYKQMIKFSDMLDSELDVPPAIRRQALNIRAHILEKNGKPEAAVQAYIEARAADSSRVMDGDHLDQHLRHYYGDDIADYSSYIATLKSWTPLERLTWMAWKFEDEGEERHGTLAEVAAFTGEADFVIEMYKEAIAYLDNVNAGAPLRLRLAHVYLEVTEDLENARKTLDEVLDSGSTGWPYAITDEAPDITLEDTLQLQSDVLFRMFRASSDPKVKQELLDAAKGLVTRPLALDVPPDSDTWILDYKITVARMVWKMGPAVEFQRMLQSIIDACFKGLADKVGWNDATNLVVLGQALRILSQVIPDGENLRKMSLIVSSARFCQLSSSPISDEDNDGAEGNEKDIESEVEQSDDDESECGTEDVAREKGGRDESRNYEEEDDDDDDDSKSPTDEGDLGDPDLLEWVCDGSCIPSASYSWWGNKIAYQCNTCGHFLCESCHEALRQANEGKSKLKGRKYCGKGHDLFKVPIEGWKGIKDGVVRIEGEKDMPFQELLQHLRDDVLTKAWEEFWVC